MRNTFFDIRSDGLTKSDFLKADPNIDLSSLDDDFCIKSVSTLENAQSGDLSFFTITLVSGDKYRHDLENTKASFCILKSQYKNINNNVKPIISDEPYITFMRLCKMLFLERKNNNLSKISESAKISKTVSIGDGVKIGENVIIDDFVTIGNGVKIGDGCVVKSGARIGNNCVIGENCCLCENCVVQYSEIGNNCIIQSNATIGQDGFGYIFDRRIMKHEKIHHFGSVIIGNMVEIGSNTCIDRGVFESTIISDDVKLDNLIQIGHNVKIGSSTVIAGQSGIAGSSVIGNNCMIGGKCGISGHITLGDQCIVYGATNVAKSFPKHSKIIGAMPGEFYHIWVKNYSIVRQFIKSQRRKIGMRGNVSGGITGCFKNLFGFLK